MGWDPWGVYSVSSFYWALGLDVYRVFSAFVAFRLIFLFYLFSYFLWRGVACSIYGPLAFSSEVPSAWRGGLWLEGAGLPAMGAQLCLGAGCAKVEAPGHPGHPPPLSDAAVK